MHKVKTLSVDEYGVRTVTDGKETWQEYPPFERGVIRWFEQEVLFHPYTWYTKTLSFLFDWLILIPLTFPPLYQLALIYFASPWVGLGGWEWWQIAIKLVLLLILWIPLAIFLTIWVTRNAVGENGILGDDWD